MPHQHERKTVIIITTDGRRTERKYRASKDEILKSVDIVFEVKKVIISGREYVKTGCGFSFVGRLSKGDI